MKWSDPQDGVDIARHVRSESEREILALTELMAEVEDPAELSTEDLFGHTPDQILNAMVLVVSHFDGGDDFFEKLTPIEKAMVRFQVALILASSNEYAAEQSHKGEADETLADSEE